MRKGFVSVVTVGLLVMLASSAMAVPIGSFVPFGGAGDARLAPNDDGSTSQQLLVASFPYFGSSYTSLWVNNNGNIPFDGPLATYTPFSFPGPNVIIAPYFADVDTQGSADVADGLDDVYYSERSGVGDLTLMSGIVNSAFGGSFSASSGYVATWDHVGYYYRPDHDNTLLNTFQVALATDGGNSYAIFQYLDDGMSWETGDASGGSGGFGGVEATAGFDKGNNADYYTIAGSMAPGIANTLEDGSNVSVAGRWIFRIDQAQIQSAGTIPEPATLILLGAGVAGMVIRRRSSKK